MSLVTILERQRNSTRNPTDAFNEQTGGGVGWITPGERAAIHEEKARSTQGRVQRTDGSLYTTTNHIRLVVVLVLHC